MIPQDDSDQRCMPKQEEHGIVRSKVMKVMDSGLCEQTGIVCQAHHISVILDIYNSGTNVACNDSGVLPVIRLDLSKANIKEAGKNR